MNAGKYVFSQILSLINKYEFDKCVKRYRGDYRTRELNCWNQFIQLFFGQLTARHGLRDICLCLNAHREKLYHLGIKQNVHQSTLSRANENRDWRIFADFGDYLIRLVRPLYSNSDISNIKLENDVLVLDSTTISVSLTLWKWARGKRSRGAVKAHTLLDLKGNIPAFIHITDGKYHDVNAMDEMPIEPNAIYVMDKAYVDFSRLYTLHKQDAFFVVRAKSNLRFKVVESRKVDKSIGLRCDQTIRLEVYKSKKQYPEYLRRITYYDCEKELRLVFLTNNFEAEALEVAALYKNRWQVELFFKWIKQNLQIKTLWGHSENAVKIHIWIAVCTYLVIAYLKIQLKSPFSIYEIMQILGISVFDKTPVNELLTKIQINQNVNEQLNLFNFNEILTHQ
jgi:FOG: Transposase and inactivated derivatives